MSTFRPAVERRRADLIALRRDFHRHPELAFEEIRTAGIVAERLRALGMEVRAGVGRTGVIGLLEGGADGPTVLLRADMDALPIQEQSEHSYRSETPGKMHACGHDAHTAILLTVADLLAERRSELRGRVKFVFQPAEEIGGGADAMIADGALRDPVPDVALGLHLWNDLPLGEVAVTPGPIMAGADSLHVTIQGRGSHGALPHLAADPVLALAESIVMLQSVVSRSVGPLDAAVVSVTQVQAGTAVNIIPDDAHFHGTIRAFDAETRAHVFERVEAIVGGTARALGCRATVEFERMARPVINDPAVAERVAARLEAAEPDLVLRRDFRTMAAEDMASFLAAVSGAFLLVGSAPTESAAVFPHHHPRFDVDERALAIGARVLVAAAADYLLPDAAGGGLD